MAEYELSDEQVKTLIVIINDSNIKGSAAPIIVGLFEALSSPVKREVE
jgi:hypothetical protein